jgi:DNA-binding transcriptional MocR family regulator
MTDHRRAERSSQRSPAVAGSVGATALAGLLSEVGERSGPLHRRISDSLRELIDVGELPPLVVLPSERLLASTLSISRSTVVSAYDALREEGRLESRRGSGTWVSAARGPSRSSLSRMSYVVGGSLADRFINGPLATIDLSNAAPTGLDIVAEVAGRLSAAHYLDLSRGHGYAPEGLQALRRAIADAYSHEGLGTSPDQILITSGAQQALQLLTQAFMKRGDVVLVEDPTYRGAIDSFRRANVHLKAVDELDAGADWQSLVRHHAATAVYVMSTVHSPTGAAAPVARRQQWIRAARDNSVLLIDDATLRDTTFRGRRQVPLAALGDLENIVTIGSMSKLFWGGLRVGWVRGSAQLISRLARAKGRVDLGTSLISQLVSSHLLDARLEAIEARSRELAQGYESLTGALSELLPSWQWTRPVGGGSLWVQLPFPCATGLAQVALRHGVAISPGSSFSVTGNLEDHIRLPFTSRPASITAAVERLASAWDALGGAPSMLSMEGAPERSSGEPLQSAHLSGEREQLVHR